MVSQRTTRIVVLDLSQVEFMDAGGLNALVSLHHWTRNHGIQLKLTHPSRLVHEMLTRTRLNRVFEISSLHDALADPERRGLSSRKIRIRIYGPGASPGGKISRCQKRGAHEENARPWLFCSQLPVTCR